MRPACLRSLLALVAGAGLSVAAPAYGDAGGVRLTYAFRPDCFRTLRDDACDPPGTQGRLDLGPQIAVWLEKADGSFVADLMVTNLTAVRGIGNRPGYWKFPSTWRFPYGKRVMVLPVWAHRRGKLYKEVVLQDDGGASGGEMGIGFHEAVSSPDPYYCLSFKPPEWVFKFPSVDAITCATSVFSSSKGTFSGAMTYYPPRNDLSTTTARDCPTVGMCPVDQRSAGQFADMNDLDAVAAATPPYGKTFSDTWEVPADLSAGDYALLLEISKEFDVNAAHTHPSYVDPRLPSAGFTNNFGQPSVVFRVPIRIDHTKSRQAAVAGIAGYGDWDGSTGTMHPPDETISDAPGSGRGRLLTITQPSMTGGEPMQGRLHVATLVQGAGGPDGSPPGAEPMPDAEAPAMPIRADGADAGAPTGAGGSPMPAPIAAAPADGGCSCALPHKGRGGGAGVALAALAALALRRRRRRAR